VAAVNAIERESKEASIRVNASGYLRRIAEFEFYIALTFALPVFEISDRLATQLQGKAVSAGQGADLV